MKLVQRGLGLLIGLAAVAASGQGMSTVTINGQTYSQISDVHVASGGRITIMYGLGGRTVRPEQLPAGFLDSWGITQAALERAARRNGDSGSSWLANQEAQLTDQAVEAGVIRESDGVVYDLRKPTADWERFVRAKIVATVQNDAVVDRTPDGPEHNLVLVFNAPTPDTLGEATFLAKRAGSLKYEAHSMTNTVFAYDAGQICKMAEVPEAIVKGGAAEAGLPDQAARAKAEAQARMDAAPKLAAYLDRTAVEMERQKEEAGPWMTSLSKAQAIAAQRGRLIFVYFTGSDWSAWCKKMDAEVFETKQFLDYADKYLVLVRADFPQQHPQPDDLRKANETLKRQFGVTDFPTMVAIKADGSMVWKQAGYLEGGTVSLLAELDKLVNP